MHEKDFVLQPWKSRKVVPLEGQTHRTPDCQRVEVSIKEGRCHVIVGIPIKLAEHLVFAAEADIPEIAAQIDFLDCAVVLEIGVFLNPEDRSAWVDEVGNSPIDFFDAEGWCRVGDIKGQIEIGFHEMQTTQIIKY